MIFFSSRVVVHGMKNIVNNESGTFESRFTSKSRLETYNNADFMKMYTIEVILNHYSQ